MTATALMRPRARHLVWLPAVLLVAWGLLSAAGGTVSPTSYAATSSGTTVVEGTVLPHIDLGGTCDGGTLSGATLDPALGETSLGTCTLTFQTTNGASGATLYAEHNRTNALQPAFCLDSAAPPANCTASLADSADNQPNVGDGQFGIRVEGVTNCDTETWDAAAATDTYGTGPLPTPGFGETVCATSADAVTATSYNLRFVADAAAATTSGDYEAQILFTAEAL